MTRWYRNIRFSLNSEPNSVHSPTLLTSHNGVQSTMDSAVTKSLSYTEINSVNAGTPTLETYPQTPRTASRWSQVREIMREPMAEFAGVAVFVMIGTAVDCQVVLSGNKGVASSPKGDFLSVNLGWATGLAMGAWVSGGISGGHLNPAVTLALATWRGFSWKKVPAYILAQVLGGLAGAAVIYGNYARAIDIFEGGHGARTIATGGLFATFALDYMSNIGCFFVELLGTAILAFMVFSLTDNKNNALPSGMLPLALFVTLLGLGIGLGMQTSYAFNPARDFGPRLLLTFAGYGKQLYSYRSQYWLWCPIIGPILGAQMSAAFYEFFLRKGGRFGDDDESPKTVTNAV